MKIIFETLVTLTLTRKQKSIRLRPCMDFPFNALSD